MYTLDPVVFLPGHAVETNVAGAELRRRGLGRDGSRDGED
jgi:hypothetical protein